MTKSAFDALVMRDGDLDLRSLGKALRRRKHSIIWPTLLVAIASGVAVNLVAPRYKSEARILYDGRENVFLRPEAEKSINQDRGPADVETVTNQIQIVLSRPLALEVIGELKLNDLPEFDPVLHGISALRGLMQMAGISRDLLAMSPEERVLESWYDRLAAYPLDKSRVIVIEFQSGDPALAARIANAIAERYLRLQQSGRLDQTRGAGVWLANEIEKLRPKVAEAEAKADAFRSRTNLFVGTNNTILSNQQLGEFNSQIAVARGQQTDAETRARIIRDMLQRGEPIELGDVINSELIRRLSEQRVTLRAQLAEQSSTLLDGHPRIKELRAQIGDLDRQIKAEAEKLIRTLENDARIAAARVAALGQNFEALKRQAASINEQDVDLRALEREAKAQRDLLETYLARYRETTARDTIGNAPPDAKIISQAVVSNTPAFPKKVPIVALAALIAFILSAGLVATGELLRATAARPHRREAEYLVDGVSRHGGAIAFDAAVASPSPQSKSAVADFDRFIEWPKPAYTRFRMGEGRGGGSGGCGTAVSHPPTPTPDPSPAEPRYSEGSATQQSDRSRQQPTSVGGEEKKEGRSGAIADATPEIMAEAQIAEIEAAKIAPPPAPAVALVSVANVAQRLRENVEAGRGVALFGATAHISTSRPALTLARALATDARVVLVGLAGRSPVLEAVSASPNMPGLTDVVRETASFGQVIGKDKLSNVHLIHHGRADLPFSDLVNAQLVKVMMEALARAYTHVIVDAGHLGVDCFRLAALTPRCVLIAPDDAPPETAVAYQMLAVAGFADIMVMSESAAAKPHGLAAA